MYNTCFDQHWSSSDVSKTATHDIIRGITHDHRTHGGINEGISQKLNLEAEAQQFHQQF
jgi:hypothetical protein